MEAITLGPGLAVLLLVAGGLAAARSVSAWRRALALDRDPARALAYARAIRTSIIALCALALAVGVACSHEWLVPLALIVLGEEMVEAGIIIRALRADPRSGSSHRAGVAG